ncbi:MAG TPA: YbhN family protein [Gaiellaceae bacterium]|nr:YbhN family protein [Gaiellaceae bacterium]
MKAPRRISELRPWAVVALAGVVFLGTLAVMSAIAGWSDVVDQLRPNLSFWFAIAFAAEALSFAAYIFAYRGIAHIENGPRLTWRESTELVAVGFGAFLAKGGAAIDAKALSSGRGGKEGEIRVLALDALEHAPLAPAACAASIALLVEGKRQPPLDFTIPWATLVPVGAVLAFVGVRHRRRFVDQGGWRGHLGRILSGIHILFRLAHEWKRHWPAFAGATVYWAGDVLCLWASLKPFGPSPAIPPVILAHAVGYVLTRRTLPLAGAGVVEVLMPLTLVAAGMPFPGAVLGVITYRAFNLWLPLLPAALALPRARRTLRQEAHAHSG